MQRLHKNPVALGSAVIGGVFVLAALIQIVQFVTGRPSLLSFFTQPTPKLVATATLVPPLDCPQGVVTTIRAANPPPNRLDVKIKLRGHRNGGGSPASTTYAEIDIRCDGDTVQFNHKETVDCNGSVLRFENRLGGGVYIGDVPPPVAGAGYVCEYKQSDGHAFRIPITTMPQPMFLSPTDGASIHIPKTAPLIIQFTQGGSNNYVASAEATDSVGDSASSQQCGDSGSCPIEAAQFTTPYPTPPPGFPTPSPGFPNGVFVPGPGHITLSRLYINANFQIIGTAFHTAMLDYAETSAISVNWT